MLRQVPNALTTVRLLLAFFFPLVVEAHRLTVVLVALATEYLDGALSRRWNAQSRFGRLLDPIADKFFFASVGLTFAFEGKLALWQLTLLAIRDLAVALWSLKLAVARDWGAFRELRPEFPGKATTTLQYVCLFDLLLRARVHPVLVALTAAFGTWAALRYYRQAHEP